MRHKVIVQVDKGEVVSVTASGETEVVIVDYDKKIEDRIVILQLEEDKLFEVGKGHEQFMGHVRIELRKKGI